MQEPWSAPGYTHVRELGRGASGRVVLAEHDATGTAVAVKYLADDLRRDPGFLADFRHEAEVLASLDVPEVVRLWEYLQNARGAAIVMDLVDGVSLRRMLDDRGPTAPESALWVMQGSLRGLRAAHAQGIVHRDYKPENVMVDADGRSHLTDFGLAAAAGAGVAGSGTAAYMAPEQWSGASASPATDIYATTATFVECLTGLPPYPGPGVDLLRRQHENAPIPLQDVPAPLHGLVTRGLAKDPGGRPADAAGFLDELGVAAVAGYGEDWEDRGRRRLAERAALLALLFPLAAGAAGASAVATTTLGSAALGALAGNRARILVGAGIAALFVGGTAVATLASSSGTDISPVAAAGVNGAGPVAVGSGVGSGVGPGIGPSSGPGALGSGPTVGGTTPSPILAGIFSPPGVPALTTDVAPVADTAPAADVPGPAARAGGAGAGAPAAGGGGGRGVPAGGAPVAGGGGGVPAGGAPVAGGGAPGTTTGAGTGAGAGTASGSGSGAGAASGSGSGAGAGSGAGTGSGSGTGTSVGSGSGTTAGSGSGAGSSSGSGAGSGSASGSGSGSGGGSGAGSASGSTSGSGSGNGSGSGSGSGAGSGTTAGSGSGGGSGSASGSGSGSSSGSGSDDPVDYGGCPGCTPGGGYGGIVK